MDDSEFRNMLLDSMEKGFLENIIDLFRHDDAAFPCLVDMVRDERIRVRMGAIALTEELRDEKLPAFVRLLPDLTGLLDNHDPVIRGDTAYLLGIIRHPDSVNPLRQKLNDENENVRKIAGESIADILGTPSTAHTRFSAP